MLRAYGPRVQYWRLPLASCITTRWPCHFAAAWMYAVSVALSGVVTLVLLWQNPPMGFLFAWVFAILIPTSVVPILTEMGAERRMYLPLVAFVVLFVVGGYALVQMLAGKNRGASAICNCDVPPKRHRHLTRQKLENNREHDRFCRPNEQFTMNGRCALNLLRAVVRLYGSRSRSFSLASV